MMRTSITAPFMVLSCARHRSRETARYVRAPEMAAKPSLGPIMWRERHRRYDDSIDKMVDSINLGSESFATHFSIGEMLEGPGRVFLPLYYTEVPIDLQDLLRKMFAEYLGLVPLGLFEQSFPDLNDFAKQLDGLRSSDLRLVLDGEIARSGDKVEVLGLSIPSPAIRSWGIFVLLSVQLYFLIHIRVFHRMACETGKLPSTAWIGLYPDWL